MKAETVFPLPVFATSWVNSIIGPFEGVDAPFGFQEITTDSRKVGPNSLFVAIPGDQFDGHDFIDSAVQKGARGIICRSGTQTPSGACYWKVKDSLTAYRDLAQAWRKKFHSPVIQIAGSVGKTTTKEILSALLQGKYSKVLKTLGSQNGFVGIPMTLLELRPEDKAAVIEVGIDDIGAMVQHLRLVQADAALLTPIAPEHLEKLIDLPTVAREEILSLKDVDSRGGITVVSLDDPWCESLVHEVAQGKRLFFTLESKTLPQGVSVDQVVYGQLDPRGESLEVTPPHTFGKKFRLKQPLPGRHNSLNLLAASTLCLALGLSSDEIESGLAAFVPAKGRSEVQQLTKDITVLCDYYNASPLSMRAGLKLLDELSQGHRKIICLGDMLELGTGELDFHRELSEAIIQNPVHTVFLYGERMKALQIELEKLKKSGKFKGDVFHKTAHSEIADELRKMIKPRDFVLIKGSRGMKMEEVWKTLKEFFAQLTQP